MEIVFQLDKQIFLYLNTIFHTSLVDSLALALSGIGTAGLVWLLIGIFYFIREERKDYWFFVPILLAGGLSWFIVTVLLKPYFGRLRPNMGIGALVLGDPSDDFSFPSMHATIAWAMAVVLARKKPAWKYFFYLLAVLISLSRVYLGKHYPSDVAGGWLLGLVLGLGILKAEHYLKRKLGYKKPRN